MNLFFLDIDPKKAAQYHCDKHVVKMILELVQMLFTAHRVHGTKLPEHSFQAFNPQHPTVIWVRLCIENYNYTADVAYYLTQEYTLRYNKIHACEKHVHWLRANVPVFKKVSVYSDKVKLVTNEEFETRGMTPVPLAMPPDSMKDDPIKSYRFYYNLHKKRFATWKTVVPKWYIPNYIEKYIKLNIK
jgi:hypothetical protein